MKNLVLLCLLAIMALTANAETKYDFDISYFDVAPLYSRQSEADQYKIGKIYTSEVWIDADSLSYDIRYCKYELCNDEKWTKVLITYNDDLEDKEVKLSVYVPTTYVRYEIPITRSSDGLSAYELLEDKELDDYYGNDIVIPKNEVVIVETVKYVFASSPAACLSEAFKQMLTILSVAKIMNGDNPIIIILPINFKS